MFSSWAEIEYSNLARTVYVQFYIPLAMKVGTECVKLYNGCALPTQIGTFPSTLVYCIAMFLKVSQVTKIEVYSSNYNKLPHY